MIPECLMRSKVTKKAFLLLAYNEIGFRVHLRFTTRSHRRSSSRAAFLTELTAAARVAYWPVVDLSLYRMAIIHAVDSNT